MLLTRCEKSGFQGQFFTSMAENSDGGIMPFSRISVVLIVNQKAVYCLCASVV